MSEQEKERNDMSEEVPVTSTITVTYPDGTPFANTFTSTAQPIHYSTSGAWYGVVPPSEPIPLTTGINYANISPADIERIADVVIEKIELRARLGGRKLGRKIK